MRLPTEVVNACAEPKCAEFYASDEAGGGQRFALAVCRGGRPAFGALVARGIWGEAVPPKSAGPTPSIASAGIAALYCFALLSPCRGNWYNLLSPLFKESRHG